MISVEENELLTRIGPQSRMGNLMRRYWHPIAGSAEMSDRWTKRVRLLGEDLVLFKDRSGAFGLVAEQCPHRRASLAYGIPETDGIRCPYHGWKFNATGQCMDQPNEPEGSTFKEKIKTGAYPVQELGGMLFAYMGPAPVPLLPRLDGLVAEGAIRMIGKTTIPCNWLQIMENSVDPVHTEWLHGRFFEFLKEKDGLKVAIAKHHVKIAFDEFEYGIIKRRLMEGQSEDASDWRDGHPIVFPTILAVGTRGGMWQFYAFQMRAPIDDTTTEHYWYYAFIPPKGTDVPRKLLDEVPVFDAPVFDAKGDYLLDYIHVQDVMAWVKQGPIANRSLEHLAAQDRGVTMLRRMLLRELRKVEAGEDPMCVFRDPEQNRVIELPLEHGKDMQSDGIEAMFKRNITAFSPVADELLAVLTQSRSREGTLAAVS